MTSRDRIFKALRGASKPFQDAAPRPDSYLPATRLEDKPSPEQLLARFTLEAQRRDAEVHVVPDTEAAIQTVLDLIGTERTAIAWEDLPVPGLVEALAAHQIRIVIPRARDQERVGTLKAAETIRIGITGADAAFATTGTLALVTDKGHGRVPSLLAPVHIALLRRDRLFPRMEDWFATEGRAAMLSSRSIALVTGPSTTGDIEQISIRGVHGPGIVHIVVF